MNEAVNRLTRLWRPRSRVVALQSGQNLSVYRACWSEVLCERKQLALIALVVQCLPFLIKCVNTGFELIVLDGGAIVETKVS